MLIARGTTDELTEERMVEILTEATASGPYVLACGSARVELTGKRIFGRSLFHPGLTAAVKRDPNVGIDEWALLSGQPDQTPTLATAS